MISFFPFPYPVATPLGEGYAIYVTPAPLYENDVWAVQLDDSRILHFSTNQLRGVPNGTYDIAMPKNRGAAVPADGASSSQPGLSLPHLLMHYAVGTGTACGAGGDASTDPTKTTCEACHKLTLVPDDKNPLLRRGLDPGKWKHTCVDAEVVELSRSVPRCTRCRARVVLDKPQPPPRPPLETLRKWSAARGIETKVLKHPQVIARPILVRCDECDWTYPFASQEEASEWSVKHPHGLKPTLDKLKDPDAVLKKLSESLGVPPGLVRK